jgi:hypothetical protein
VTKRSGPSVRARSSAAFTARSTSAGPAVVSAAGLAAARAVCRVSAVTAAASAPVPQTSAMSTIQRPSGSGMTS